ncbi:MAG TPA: YqgE/AlgH family protein [Usitatibacter sp.]|nr:YqgE/AlgH family protein [Usitatibacter sp.]
MSLRSISLTAARAACALAALAAAVPCPAAETARAKPVFLVARDGIDNRRFEHAVVLLLERGRQGASGVIVSRPGETTLAAAFPQSKRLAGRDDALLDGGPVEPDSLAFLFRSRSAVRGTTEVAPGVRMGSSLALLRKLLDRRDPTRGLRVVAGLTAWGPGQLEAEIARGAWRILPVDARSLVETPPEALWRELHARAFPPGS